MPLVTVVVVTLNNMNLLRNCLRSIFDQDYKEIEVIVVDNGSDEDIQGMVSREFSRARIISLDKNYGFAGGNNKGIEAAHGKYVALINNDAIAEQQWIRSMIITAEDDARIGAVASIIIDGNRPGVLDSCGVGIAYDGMSRQAMRGRPVPQLAQPKEVLLFSGCACLLQMKALEEVGLFDEDFFAYCEDTDLGLRLRSAGWKIVAAPKAYVHHYYSLTGGKYSLKKMYWVERNHFWVAVKNFPWYLLTLVPFVTMYRYFAQAYFIGMGAAELIKFHEQNDVPAILRTYIKVYKDILIKLPDMLAKRRAFLKRHRLKKSDIARLIWRFRLPIHEIMGMGRR